MVRGFAPYAVFDNCRESSTNQPCFMQNKANFQKTQMNVSIFSKMAYENKSNRTLGENKPNSNPIKAYPERSRMGQFSSRKTDATGTIQTSYNAAARLCETCCEYRGFVGRAATATTKGTANSGRIRKRCLNFGQSYCKGIRNEIFSGVCANMCRLCRIFG